MRRWEHQHLNCTPEGVNFLSGNDWPAILGDRADRPKTEREALYWMGNRGWELVAVVYAGIDVFLYFKRPIDPE